MNEHTVTLTREKETKNTIRFQETVADGQPPVLGSLYVPKWVCGDEQQIEVTVRPVNGTKGNGAAAAKKKGR